MTYPFITKTPHWSAESVRAACIRNHLYTNGTNEAYSKMLSEVSKISTPSDIGIYMIARDIAEHSDEQPITNVMFILANEAITYTFLLDGSAEI